MTLEIKRQEEYSRGDLLLRSFFGIFYIAIPHIFVMYFVSIYVGIMGFIAWWVMLFTGRFPKETFNLMVKFQSWGVRFSAVMSNLADPYPQIGLEGSHPNVTYHVPYPETVSRGSLIIKAMFGIFYVVLPHVFVLLFRSIWGSILSMLAFWVILFTGSYPEAWFNFQVGTMRWSQRISLYLSHMDDQYPPFSGKSDQELGRDQSPIGFQQDQSAF